MALLPCYCLWKTESPRGQVATSWSPVGALFAVLGRLWVDIRQRMSQEQGRGKGSWREQHYLTKTPENREGKHERGRPRRQGRQEAPPDKGGGKRLFTWHKAAGPRAGRAAPWCLCSPAGLALEGQVKQGTRSLPLSPSK